MKLQASSAFEPEACNLKSLITPETDSCSVAYALFTADYTVYAARNQRGNTALAGKAIRRSLARPGTALGVPTAPGRENAWAGPPRDLKPALALA